MMRRPVPVFLIVLCLSLWVAAQTPQNPTATNSGSTATSPNAGISPNNGNSQPSSMPSAPTAPPSPTADTPAASTTAPAAGNATGTPSGTASGTTSGASSATTGTGTATAGGTSGTATTTPNSTTTPSSSATSGVTTNTNSTVAPDTGASTRRVAGDPLDPPPLPQTSATLIGGTVDGIDRVRNHINVRPFGGKKIKVTYDERTHFYRNGVETTFAGVKKGDRIYIDTQLDGTNVFARNVRVRNEQGPADARGQVVSVEGGRIGLRDDLSGRTVMFVTSGNTKVMKSGAAASLADVKEGSLVSVKFTPDRADRGAAQEIDLIAAPGDTFTFTGRVTHLDIAHGVLAVQNQTDNKNYEVNFDPGGGAHDDLGIGQDVTVTALFDGSRYMAKDISVTKTAENR
jgi:hypothetical protein